VNPEFTPAGHEKTEEGAMATQAQPRGAMQFINEQNAATLERFIERLEFRAKDPTFTAYREAYPELLDLRRVRRAASHLRGTRRSSPEVRATPF
jgi:hypothetical protein